MTIVGTAEISILANDSQFDQSLRGGTSKSFDNLSSDADKAGRDVGSRFTTGFSGAGAKAGADAETGIKSGLGRAATSAEKGGKDIGEGINSGVKGALGTFGNLLAQFGLPLEGLGEKFEKASAAGGIFGGKLGGISAIGAGTTVGLLAAGAAAVDLGDKYSDSTAKLSASANITSAAAKSIGNAFLSSGSTVVASGQQQITAYTAVAAQLGAVQGHALTTKQAVEFMGQAMDLAEESGSNLGSTTKSLSQLMATFQVPLSQTASTTTALFNASRITSVSIDSLTSTMDRLKSRLGVTAPSVQDLSSLLVDLQEHGVQGSRGLLVVNTAINTLLSNTGKLSGAEAQAASTYSTKLASAQESVAKASEALAKAQGKTGTAATLAGEQSVLASEKAGAAAQKAAEAVTAAQEKLAAEQAKVTTTAAQAASKQSSIAADQVALQKAIQNQATLTSEAQVKGSVAATSAGTKNAAATLAVQVAQDKLAAAQDKLNTIQKTGASISNSTVAALANLGINAYTAQGKFAGMESIIAQLQPKLKGLTQEQQINTLSSVFGASASKALLDTVLAGPAAYEKAQKAVTDTAAAHHALQVQQATLSHELEALKVQVVDAATKFGVVLVPYVLAAVKAVTGFITFIAGHKDVLIAFAAVIGTLLAGAVAVFAINVGTKMVNSVESAVKSLGKLLGIGEEQVAQAGEQAAATEAQTVSAETLSASLDMLVASFEAVTAAAGEMAVALGGDAIAEGVEAAAAAADSIADDVLAASETAVDVAGAPILLVIGLIVAAVAALGIGIYELVTHWSTVWKALKEGFQDFLGFAEKWGPLILAPLTGGLSLLVPLIIKHFDAIKGVFNDIIDFFKHWGLLIVEIIAVPFTGGLSLIVPEIIKHWDDIKGVFNDVVDFFKKWGVLILEVIAAPFTLGLSLIIPEVASHWDEIVSFFEGIPDKIASALSSVFSTITGAFGDVGSWVTSHIIDPVVDFFTGLPDKVGNAVTGIFDKEVEGFGDIASWVNTNIIQPVVAFFTALPGDIATAVVALFNDIITGFGDVSAWVDTNIIQPVIGFFTALPGQVATGLTTIFSKITTAFGDVGGWVNSNVIQPVLNFFTALPGQVGSAMASIFSKITGAFLNAAQWVDANVTEPIVNFFSALPGRVGSALASIFSRITTAFGNVGGWVNGNVIEPVINWFVGMPGRVTTGLANIFHAITNAFAGVVSWIQTNVIDKIVNAFKNLPGQVAGSVGSIANSVAKKIPGVSAVEGLFGGAEGGIVPGPKGAPLVMVAHGGEMILPPDIIAGGYTPIPGLPPSVNGPLSGQGGGQKDVSLETALAAFNPGRSAIPGTNIAQNAPTSQQVPVVMPSVAGKTIEVNQTFNTPMSATAVANEVGWALRVAPV